MMRKSLFLIFFFVCWACSSSKPNDAYTEEVTGQVQSKIIPEFMSCYQKMAPPREDFRGEMTLRFVISVEGMPSKVTFEGPAYVAVTVQECVKASVLKMTFGKPPQGQAVLITAPMTVDAKRLNN